MKPSERIEESLLLSNGGQIEEIEITLRQVVKILDEMHDILNGKH